MQIVQTEIEQISSPINYRAYEEGLTYSVDMTEENLLKLSVNQVIEHDFYYGIEDKKELLKIIDEIVFTNFSGHYPEQDIDYDHYKNLVLYKVQG